jgi:hypothetical protein
MASAITREAQQANKEITYERIRIPATWSFDRGATLG